MIDRSRVLASPWRLHCAGQPRTSTLARAGRRSTRHSGILLALFVVVLLLAFPGGALAVQCGIKQAPPDPYGTSYGQINVPSAPNTYHAYYSLWSSPDAYYARRIRPDGTYAYEQLYSGGGLHDFSNTVDVDRRTQLKNNDGTSGWSYWVQANSLTTC